MPLCGRGLCGIGAFSSGLGHTCWKTDYQSSHQSQPKDNVKELICDCLRIRKALDASEKAWLLCITATITIHQSRSDSSWSMHADSHKPAAIRQTDSALVIKKENAESTATTDHSDFTGLVPWYPFSSRLDVAKPGHQDILKII